MIFLSLFLINIILIFNYKFKQHYYTLIFVYISSSLICKVILDWINDYNNYSISMVTAICTSIITCNFNLDIVWVGVFNAINSVSFLINIIFIYKIAKKSLNNDLNSGLFYSISSFIFMNIFILFISLCKIY